MVDLDGARAESMVHLDVLRVVASQTDLVIDYSGGIRTIDDVQTVFGSGANIVTLGSLAVRSPEAVADWERALALGIPRAAALQKKIAEARGRVGG